MFNDVRSPTSEDIDGWAQGFADVSESTTVPMSTTRAFAARVVELVARVAELELHWASKSEFEASQARVAELEAQMAALEEQAGQTSRDGNAYTAQVEEDRDRFRAELARWSEVCGIVSRTLSRGVDMLKPDQRGESEP